MELHGLRGWLTHCPKDLSKFRSAASVIVQALDWNIPTTTLKHFLTVIKICRVKWIVHQILSQYRQPKFIQFYANTEYLFSYYLPAYISKLLENASLMRKTHKAMVGLLPVSIQACTHLLVTAAPVYHRLRVAVEKGHLAPGGHTADRLCSCDNLIKHHEQKQK